MQVKSVGFSAIADAVLLVAGVGDAVAQDAKYGALSVDRNNGFHYGFAFDHPSRAAAEAFAGNECTTRGGNCSIVLSWSGAGCGAYRTIDGQVGTAYGWGLAPTSQQADAIAMAEAMKRSNGQHPSNHVWSCNSADAGAFQALVNEAGPDAGPLRFVDVDGDAYTYTGPLVDGQPHGQGVAVWDDGGRYEGSFANGRLSGFGTKTWPSGSKYVGEWSNDYQNGQGVNVFPSGARYEGEVRNAKMHGYGRFYDSGGNLQYEGRYVDNEPVD